MKKNPNPRAQKLLEAFRQFHKLNWKPSPIGDLKSSEILVLHCVKKMVPPDSAGIKISDISRTLRVASPTITQLVNSLEVNGFVDRTMDKEDRRVIRVSLTHKGEKAVEKVTEAFDDAYNGLVEHLGSEKSDLLAELLSETFTYFDERKKKKF